MNKVLILGFILGMFIPHALSLIYKIILEFINSAIYRKFEKFYSLRSEYISNKTTDNSLAIVVLTQRINDLEGLIGIISKKR